MKVRVRSLTVRCTEEIDDLFFECQPTGLVIGRSFIEGDHTDLLDIANELRQKEVWFDHNTDNPTLQRQSIKVAEEARQRWARKIERAVYKADLTGRRGYGLL
jgi:hypothetical protein